MCLFIQLFYNLNWCVPFGVSCGKGTKIRAKINNIGDKGNGKRTYTHTGGGHGQGDKKLENGGGGESMDYLLEGRKEAR